MKVEIIAADYHRNGVGGEPFYVVLFNDLESEDHDQNPMVAVLFHEPMTCAVLSVPRLATATIEFGMNSWRGDRYSDALRPALQTWLKKNERCEMFA